MQMEIATLSSIVRSTDLSEVAVGEALRALSQLGVIYETDDAYRLSLYWYQDVRRLLERQNLIVRSVS
jgi:predicted transcriptional regulator